MADTVADLAERACALAPAERTHLIELLLHSLESTDPAVDELWREELRRRVAAYERGDAVLFDADHVIAEAERLTQ